VRVVNAVAGSGLFLLAAPGTVAGLVPWALTGWRVRSPNGWSALVAGAGVLLVVVGIAVLLEQFARFALRGRGTPAPIAPPSRLVVTGLYRYVRNPMYVAVVVILIGENLLMPSLALAVYSVVATAAMVSFARWYEEPALLARFGTDYRAYRAAVPGWIPGRR
jgi:protein-S-isoprenylcysteine O-methyltransferase Ste14